MANQTTYTGNKTGSSYIPTVAKPIDVRTVINTVEDLTNGTIPYLYQGIVVNVKGTGDLYVLVTNARLANQQSSWVKVGSTTIDPADNLEYYEEKLGAKVVDSLDELTSPELGNSFVGMLGVVRSVSSESDDESGLYVLTREPNTTISNWYKILGGTGGGNVPSGLDISDVITTDGSAPASGNGFSISGNDPDAIVEEIYVDEGLEPGKYYTSRGLNSSDSNGGTDIEQDYITLTNGGDSYIRLYSTDNPDWIELSITDGSLGFTMSDVTWIDNNGNVHTMTESPLVLPKETPISFGENEVDFTGMTETRGDDPTEYVFGDSGSLYDDIDIYSSESLPTVYAYSEGNSVRVLTEGDKDEIINIIESSAVGRIPDEDILGLF